MKILFDQGTPVPLRNHLSGHEIGTAYELGWSDLKNGELLDRAEAEGYDLMVTTDQNLQYQQHLSNRSIAIVVLLTTSWPRIKLKTGVGYELGSSSQGYVIRCREWSPIGHQHSKSIRVYQ